jgi:hypothetical protein
VLRKEYFRKDLELEQAALYGGELHLILRESRLGLDHARHRDASVVWYHNEATGESLLASEVGMEGYWLSLHAGARGLSLHASDNRVMHFDDRKVIQLPNLDPLPEEEGWQTRSRSREYWANQYPGLGRGRVRLVNTDTHLVMTGVECHRALSILLGPTRSAPYAQKKLTQKHVFFVRRGSGEVEALKLQDHPKHLVMHPSGECFYAFCQRAYYQIDLD